MYEFLQIVVKVVLISATIIVATIVSVRLWYSDLDLRTLFNPVQLIKRAADAQVGLFPAREADALYQNGNPAARVEGPRVDEQARVVHFDEIHSMKQLNPDAEFEFQKWRLRLEHAEVSIGLDTSAPEKGRILRGVSCKIVGVRVF